MKHKFLKILGVLIFLIIAVALMQTTAFALTDGDFTYTVSDDGKATVTGYTGAGGNVVIPPTFGDYPVTAIGDNAFYSITSITAVTIPEGVTTIGGFAFMKCSNLETITLPSTIQSIGGTAFQFCDKISRVNVADIAKWCAVSFFNETSNPLTPGQTLAKLYVKDELIHDLVIPEGVTSIGDFAFLNCVGITSVWLPTTLTSIGGAAFSGCAGLKSIAIPHSVTLIGCNAFRDCGKLQDIYFIGTEADWAAVEKETDWNFGCPENPVQIAYGYALQNGEAVLMICNDPRAHVTIPSTVDGYPVTVLDNDLCKNNKDMLSITVPEGVKSIGDYAFSGCSNLETVTLPKTLTYIGKSAFEDCIMINKVYIKDIAAWCDIDMDSIDSTPFRGNNSYLNLYVDGVLTKDLVIPEGVTKIKFGAFAGYCALTSVKFPSTLREIGDFAFYRCNSLTNVTIPEGVTVIGSCSFCQISALKSATLPSTLEIIKVDAFNDCNLLTDIYFSGSENDWGAVEKQKDWVKNPSDITVSYPFSYTALVNGNAMISGYTGPGGIVYIPKFIDGKAVKEIGQSSFKNMTDITDVIIPEGVLAIDFSAFYGCESLRRVYLPQSIEIIDANAFQGCSLLSNVVIYNNVKFINGHAFQSCNSLKDIYFIGTEAEWNGITLDSDWIDDATIHFAFAYSVSDGKATLTSYDGFGRNVNIPSTLDGYPVAAIGDSVFKNRKDINGVSIPSTVTSIGDSAFDGCTALKDIWFLGAEDDWNAIQKGTNWDNKCPEDLKITIAYTYTVSDGKATVTSYGGPDGKVEIPSKMGGYPVTAIGNSVFKNKAGITAVTVPEGVTSIGANAFSRCSNLETVTLPSTLESVDNMAFYACSMLSRVNVADIAKWCAVEFVSSASNPLSEGCDDDKFYVGGKLIHELVIPEGVTGIGDFAFFNCCGLTSVTLPSTLESIGVAAFWDCQSLESITIPEGVKTVKAYTFHGCNSLESVTIPEGVTSIEENTFQECNSLESVTIPSTVTSIEEYAFRYCNSLESVTIPKGVTSIGKYAFQYCTSLADIYFLGTTVEWDAVTKDDSWNSGCPCGDNVHILYTYTLSNGKATITVYDGLGGDVVIPSKLDGYDVVAIGDHVFKEKDNITSITIPEGVTTIGDYAFDGCSDLETVTLPSTLESVGEMAFYACGMLSRVNVADIAKWCAVEFVNSASNPLSDGSNYDKLYVGGELIHELVIPEGVTGIGDLAFFNCRGLTSVTFPSTIQSIGVGAFWGCQSLESITIPEGVKTVKAYTFYECISLESVTIPSTVTSIKEYAFQYCTSLESVTIPSTVTSIDKYAFQSCESLNDIYYFGTAAEWDALPKGSGCFASNPDTQKIHYMCTVTVSSASDTTGTAAGGGACEIGDPVTVTATPAEHYVFVNWTVGENVVSTDANYTFTPTGDTELVANFALEKFKIWFIDEKGYEIWSGEFEYGTMPVYGGEALTKENDGDIEFVYCCWYPKLEPVTEEKDYFVMFGIETDKVCPECGKMLYCYPMSSNWKYHFFFCFNYECSNFPGISVTYGEHTYSEATCTSKPRCEYCGWIHGELDPDNHDWDDGVVTAEPTCTEDGEMLYTCKYDNSHTRTEVIPAKGHVDGEPVIENVAAPTCLTEGSYDLVTYCTVCGAETSRREVREDPLGHSFGDWTVTKPATCTEKGEETRICANNPTHKETREIAALGHDYGEWFVAIEPTEYADGLMTRVCTRCGVEETYDIPKLGHEHKLIHYPAVEPTETLEGQKEYYVCSGCGKWFEDAEGKKEITDHASVVIPALGKAEPIAYGFKIAPETEWVKGSGKDFVLTSLADFTKFVGAKADGKFLDISFFTAEEGSTKVAFKSDYLETLSAGEHVLTVVSEDGEASATVTITDPVAPDTPTENSTSPVIWIVIALVVAAVAAAAVVVVIIVKKKKK